ncbi:MULTISPECIES: YceD family protein [Marinomonas]|uniref:YceD family protein n=1 Tax=Marinomonas TaxID=28253 RepID=UPI001F0ABF3D|nr:YceD family protein [Marinomonas flavescens]
MSILFAAMLNDLLPKYFDPRKYAHHESAIEGYLHLNQLKELSAVLASDEGDAYIHLDFRVDEDRRYIATGILKATVQAVCQRCMEAVPQELSIDLSLAFVYDEDHAKNIPSDYDPVVMTDGDVILADMVEQEIILALPIVAYHEESGCNPTAVKYASSTDDAPDDEQKPNPFSILANLKAK